MPKVNMSGQERRNPPHDWKDIQNMIFENLFYSVPEEVEHIKDEVNKILEERKNVRETDKRNND